MIFDFNFFKSRKEQVEQYMDKEYASPVPPVVVPKRDQIAYSIGKTEDGKVTLSLGDYGSTTVTMNNEGVDTLIRMLEAAKEPDDE
jgi:hypothetical protein